MGYPHLPKRLWAESWLIRVGPVPVSAVTVFERAYGFERAIATAAPGAPWRERLAAYEQAVAEAGFYEVLPWHASAALLIASHAAADERSVLTKNQRDFQMISELLESPFRLTILRFPEDVGRTFDS